MSNIAIDPGKTHAGVAIFNGSQLETAFYTTLSDLGIRADVYGPFGILWLERQYLPKKHPRPMDIVELAFGAGFAAGVVTHCHPQCDVVEFQPMQWKGNVPKPIMAKRILSVLDETELAKINRVGYKDHNTIDAIGIGLYALGRLK